MKTVSMTIVLFAALFALEGCSAKSTQPAHNEAGMGVGKCGTGMMGRCQTGKCGSEKAARGE